MENEKVLICQCSDVNHQIIIRYDKEYNIAYASVYLSKLPLLKRIKNAIKYIFGYKSEYGDFEEFIISKKHSEYLKELSQQLEKNG